MSKHTQTKWGSILQEYREAQEWTLKEMSKAMGISSTYLYELEKGVKDVSASAIQLFQDLTGTPVSNEVLVELALKPSHLPETLENFPKIKQLLEEELRKNDLRREPWYTGL